MEAIEISLSGLNIEWQRMQVIAQNIANMNTSRTASGSAYVARRLVSGPLASFNRILAGKGTPGAQPSGVAVYDIASVNGGTRRVYEPSHPHADEQGFVTYPAISQAEEMTLLVKTSRAYEANLVALAAAQQIYSSALQLGRQS